MNKLSKSTIELAANPKIILRAKAMLVCEQLRLGGVTITQVLQGIEDPIERLNLAIGIATNLVYQGGNGLKHEIFQSLLAADSILESYPISEKNPQRISRVLKEINDMRETLELGYFYIPDSELDALRKKNASRSAAWVLRILKEQPVGFSDVRNLNVALEHAINYRVLSEEQLQEVIAILSPFDNNVQSSWVKANYDRDLVNGRGFFRYGSKFNGLYQELAYLYAATGNTKNAIKAIDSLLLYNQDYFQNDYGTAPDNASHIAACFYRYEKLDQLDDFAAAYCSRKKISLEEFYARLLGRCKLYEFATTALNHDVRYDIDFNLGLEYNDNNLLGFFFNKYRDVVNRTVTDPNAKKFKLALSYKDEGIIRLRKLEVAGLDSLKTNEDKLFDRAVELYRGVDPRYLNEEIEMVELSQQ